MRLEDVLRTYEQPLTNTYAQNGTDPTTYHINGLLPAEHGLPQGILFNQQHTTYGLILRGPQHGTTVDAAIIGFNEHEDTIDCLEIHGGTDRYHVLRNIHWDQALLSNLIQAATHAHKDAITLIPAIHLQGISRNNYQRLERRYDHNAKAHGFEFSKQDQRYVLPL